MGLLKAPEYLLSGQASFCPGCGHGIVSRLFAEVLDEMKLSEEAIIVMDVACCALLMFATDYDNIGAAHGRPITTAVGTKKVRKNNPVLAYLGDGAGYAIGLSHTIWSATRNDNITAIVVNNGVFGMTGGQMAPTTLIGQKTTTCPSGRCAEREGGPIRMTEIMAGLQGTAYAARVSLHDVKHIRQAKKALRRAFEVQEAKLGLGFVELLAGCPTNWRISAVAANERIANEMIPAFPLGVFKDESAACTCTEVPA